MSRKFNLQGQKFGRLLVVGDSGKRKNKKIIYLCKCDCGNLAEVRSTSLKNRNTRSCGCLQCEVASKVGRNNIKHGEAGRTRLYKIWMGMKVRCINPNAANYKWYGGRGIFVCDEWINSFMIFRDWALSNGYANNLTIDRIDNDSNYEPSNCQWITSFKNLSRRKG